MAQQAEAEEGATARGREEAVDETNRHWAPLPRTARRRDHGRLRLWRHAGAAEGDDEGSSDGPPPVPESVGGRFLLNRQIGSGSYSHVHLGIDKDTGEKVAVKLEWVMASQGLRLLYEAKLYTTALGSGACLPRVRWHGVEGSYNVMVMDLLGPSLEDLFRSCDRRFSLKTVLMLAEQMLDAIEYVHSCGVVHRDIKGSNFLIGVGERSGCVHIMDFGLAKRYRDSAGKHVQGFQKNGFTGTVRYASLNVHRGFEPSRRDDVEAIGYVLMHFNRGRLPWQGVKAGSRQAKNQQIYCCKSQISDDELCKGFPEEFVRYFQHCRSLEFSDRPDYDYLRGLMRDVFEREGFQCDLCFDWLSPDGTRRGSTGKRKPHRVRSVGDRGAGKEDPVGHASPAILD
mmetsp:Transcript_108882/g.243107  ORF Transcript_108882/g.243107 Transcript_108882/m.243107 type:complete len:398 (-) Transcript_108882:124-1317(-)